MSRILEIDGLQIELTRKKIRRMNMRIKENGRIVISAPYLTSDRDVVDFVRSKRLWINQGVEKMRRRAAAHPEPTDRAEKERLRAALKARIAERLPAIEQQTGLKCNGWTVRDMHTRWGSCNTSTHHINFSLMLATRSDEELDYVIIHELVHTRVPNHGEEFKRYMNALYPDWKRIRAELKK